MTGGSAEVDEAVEVVRHRPEWAEQGRELARTVRRRLGPAVEDAQHIGSTAVPGLSAKPVIDVAVALAPERWALALGPLAALGFEDLGEAGLPGRRYLRRRTGSLVAANVHLLAPGGRLWADNLALRDYLRADPAAAARYARAKEEAARHHPTLLRYSSAKAAVVEQLLSEARHHGTH